MALDAFVPGERDLAAGFSNLKDLVALSGANWVMSNVRYSGDPSLFFNELLIDRGGVRVGFIGLVLPETLAGISEFEVTDPKASLMEHIDSLKAKGAEQIVVLSGLGQSRDKELVQKTNIDVVFSSRTLDPTQRPVRVENTWILEPPIEGQQIGFWVRNLSRGVTEHAQIPLGKDFDNPNNEVSKLMERYKEEEIRIAGQPMILSPVVHTDKPFVAEPERCANCHKAQYDFWRQTKHSTAMLVLYGKRRHLDTDCIGCHSLGFRAAAGFSGTTGMTELSCVHDISLPRDTTTRSMSGLMRVRNS
jgi:2',3'-cyclic-nucleotide 2'-phosphodiesterase (5'-nucleotidase family)